ncbi:hypothetical protein JCM17380_00510 [Desulfosporosinus burensis]
MTNNGRVYNKEFKLENVRVIIEKGGGELLQGFQLGLRDYNCDKPWKKTKSVFPI